MAINRDFYQKIFYKKPLSFPCPSCINGHVVFTEKQILIEETIAGIESQNSAFSDNSKDMYRIAALSACGICEEPLTIIGTSRYYDDSNRKVSSGYLGGNKHWGFSPLYFHPPIHIFPISEYCPKEIEKGVLLAFSHYWNDFAASANSIRTTVELILNEQGVEKGNKEKKLKLHTRIELYKKINEKLSGRLMAVKWIGNEGSHEGKLNSDDVLDGFEILQFVLNELYELPNQTKRINELTNKINENKGASKSE